MSTIERVYGVDTIKIDIPDRVRELYRRDQISFDQMRAAGSFKRMYERPLTRTPEYVDWARRQDATIILGCTRRSCRMQIVIDLIMQGNSIAQIERRLDMSPDTALPHLKAALDGFAHLVAAAAE